MEGVETIGFLKLASFIALFAMGGCYKVMTKNTVEEFTIDQYGGRSIRDVPPEIREGIKTFFEPS